MRGLIVHEWFEQSGGAERVVDEMVRTYPSVDLYCLWNDAPGRYTAHDVTESWIARSPLRHHKATALPVMPATWRRMRHPADDGARYDWMITSSHLFAHHARLASQPDVRRFVYVHTPARYLWDPSVDTRGAHPLARLGAPWLKTLDRARAREGGQEFAANSRFVQARIQKFWGVEARVIYPPVDTTRLQGTRDWSHQLDARESAALAALPETFVLGASRFVPYKRLDAVIAAGEAADLPVVIAGAGPQERDLRDLAARAAVPVQMIISPSDALLAALLQRAAVYVFPPVEDFGIMPVEAMALGTPVVVNARGGASESVLEGVTGVHVRDFTNAREVAAAVAAAQDLPSRPIVERARDFSAEAFRARLRRWVTPLDVVGVRPEGRHGSRTRSSARRGDGESISRAG